MHNYKIPSHLKFINIQLKLHLCHKQSACVPQLEVSMHSLVNPVCKQACQGAHAMHIEGITKLSFNFYIKASC